MSQPEYPAGPCPPTEQIVNHIRSIFKEVGPHSLTMKILRLRLAAIYKIDFKEHTSVLSNLVQQVIAEPATGALLNESHKEQEKKEKMGGTRKSKSTTKRDRDDGDKKSKKDEKKSKKHRAEGEPKRGLTAFFFYSNEVRPKVQEEVRQANNGKLDVGQVGSKIGQLWNALTESEKAKYEAMAVKDKERYKTEYDAWVAAGGSKDSGSSSKTKKSKKVKDENHPKKPQTPYFAYMAEVAPAVREKSKQENGKVDISAVGKQLGVMWKALSDDEKAKFNKIADDDRARYERECREKGYPVKAKAANKDAAGAGEDSSSSSSSDSDDE